MPSKTYSAMAAGQAVLAVCPRASDLADWPKEWMRGAEAWIERQPSKESEANPTTDA